MEVASEKWRNWGTVVWGLAFGGLALGGVLDAFANVRLPRITEPGPRNSTDTMLAWSGRMQERDGTAKLRALLDGTRPPKGGVTWVVYCRRPVQTQEVFFAISLLAWPEPVKESVWELADGAPKIPGDPQHARYFFLGTPPTEPLPGLHQVGPRMWFKPDNFKGEKL